MEMRPLSYDYASFSLNTGESDFDVSAEVAALFSNVKVARNVVIFFNKAISAKFNNTLMPAIALGINRSPFQSPERFLDISNIYLSNSSGETATVEIILW